jgi:hypothetical protein
MSGFFTSSSAMVFKFSNISKNIPVKPKVFIFAEENNQKIVD